MGRRRGGESTGAAAIAPPGAREAAGPARSARALLLTVLGEFVLPSGTGAFTSTLIEALALLGVTTNTGRQAVARGAEAGWLQPNRHGRRTYWQLTDRGTRLLGEGTERIYSFGTTTPRWDGRWVLLLVPVPETAHHLRYRLRTRLGWAGFAPIGPGDWISPWPERAAEGWRVLEDLGLAGSAKSFVGVLQPSEDLRGMVAEAWSLTELEADYEHFIASHGRRPPKTPDDAFVALTNLVHEWRIFPGRDPDLPADLLPAHWSGHEAAATFHRLHEAWASTARAWWDDQLATTNSQSVNNL